VLTLLLRALQLRCPRCGARGILASWTRLKARCPSCDLATDRGETEDYWLGAFAINWVVGESIALVVALLVLLLTWPESGPALWTGITLAVLVPIALFPFSRTVWLAIDLAARPVEPGDDRKRP
jgi:uncharacterized protein (DUF983 family)